MDRTLFQEDTIFFFKEAALISRVINLQTFRDLYK